MWIRLGAMFSVALSSALYACPNLTGRYICNIENGQKEPMEITQTNSNGVTVFMINGAELPADNLPHAIVGDETFQNASVRAWCEDVRLRTELVGEFFQNQTSIGALDVTTDMSLMNDDVSEQAAGSMTNDSGQYPFNGLTNCERDELSIGLDH